MWQENLFPVRHRTVKPVLNETLNIDTNLLGELLTLQGVFQDSNCSLGSSFVAKYKLDDAVRNGTSAIPSAVVQTLSYCLILEHQRPCLPTERISSSSPLLSRKIGFKTLQIL